MICRSSETSFFAAKAALVFASASNAATGRNFGGRSHCSNWSEMSSLPELNLTAVLNTVLYLLEYTSYPGKGTETVGALKRCVHRAITDLESTQPGRLN
jgi:hypothetical protein